MAQKDGRVIRLEINSNFLKGVTTSALSLTADMIDVTNYESNKSKEYLSGEQTATITATFTFDPTVSSANFSDVFNAWKVGTLTAFVYGDATTGSEVITGNCLVSALNWNGPKNEVSTCDVTLQTSGPISIDIAS
jgi:predicted secreted protein